MIIPKRAIRAFLDRPRRDCGEWKELSDKQISRKFRKLPIRPPMWSRLRRDQKICFLLGARFKKFAFINDTGTGKTVLSIALTRYFFAAGVSGKALVLVPNRPNKGEWGREMQKHAPSIPYVILRGSSIQKWETLRKTDARIVIETYAGLVRMLCDKSKLKKKNRMRLKPNRRKVLEMRKLVSGLILDEVTYAKNPRKLPYRVCKQLAKSAEFLFTLTATPFGRDPEDIWAQMFLVDNGYTLGETLGLFRAAFFKAKDNFWGGVDYTFDKKKNKLLHQFIRDRSIRYEANAADLPRMVPIYKPVSLPSSAESYYESAKQKLIAAHGNFQEQKNAFLRMRQISSGFLGYKDDESGERAEFEFPKKPKLELLLSTILTIPKKHKIIVFTEFNYSGMMVQRELAHLGIKSGYIYGKTKDDEAERRKVEEDPECQVLILGQTGRMGLNMQVFKYGMFFESPVSAIVRKQSNRRVERQGSKHGTVFLYDFVTRGTVDEQILEFHREGADLFRAIIDGRAKPR